MPRSNKRKRNPASTAYTHKIAPWKPPEGKAQVQLTLIFAI